MTDIIKAEGPNAVLEAEIESLKEKLKVFDLIDSRDYLAYRLTECIRKQAESKRIEAQNRMTLERN